MSIPACAGEPLAAALVAAGCAVYPRVCGGTFVDAHRSHRRPGLSPRVRGNQKKNDTSLSLRGSIPACAGEPAAANADYHAGRVYPRVCGGTRISCDPGRGAIPLSPRVRGNRPHTAWRTPAARSIPACAGEPAWISPPTTPWTVYPRVCGGTSMTWAAGAGMLGLSPRVRGNRGFAVGSDAGYGLSPRVRGNRRA